jgi:hypothetical protein
MEGLWPIAHNSVITYLSLQPQCHFGWKTKKDAHFIYFLPSHMYFPYICSSISRLRHRAWRRLCATEIEPFFLFFVSIEIGHRSVYIFVLPKMTDGDFWRCTFVFDHIYSVWTWKKKPKQVGSRIMVFLTPSNKSPPQQSRWKRF